MGRKRKREEGLIFDIVYEILLRLPVKTLIRFQCVSKTWHSLITDPIFRQSHYSRFEANPLLLLTSNTKSSTIHFSVNNEDGTCIKKFSKTVDPQNCRYYPVQSCQGLVCLGANIPEYSNLVLICNPSTEELIALPPAQKAHHSMLGFGFAVSTKEFKVVRFSRQEFDEVRYFCEVFTLGTNEWREARRPPPQGYFFGWNSLFFRGALHLLPDPDYNKIDGSENGVYVFNIESEEHTTIPLPDYYSTVDRSFMVEYLQDLGGSLCLTFDFRTRMELWCLRDYGSEEWTKKYTIDVSSLGFAWIDPLAILRNGTILLSIVVRGGQSLYYYNPRDKSITQSTKLNASTIIYAESFSSMIPGL